MKLLSKYGKRVQPVPAWNGVADSPAMQEQQTLACVAADDACQQHSRTALQDRGGKEAFKEPSIPTLGMMWFASETCNSSTQVTTVKPCKARRVVSHDNNGKAFLEARQ